MAPEPKGDGTLTQEEYEALTEQAAKRAAYSAVGGTVGFALGTGGAVALGLTTAGVGAVAIPAAGLGGGTLGSMVGDAIASATTTLPKSLTQEQGVSENKSAYGNAAVIDDARRARKEKPGAKPQGSLAPQSASQMGNMTAGELSEYLVDFVKRKEGFSANAYSDHKQFSIGYGTKANDEKEVIDEKEADKRLREQLKKSQKVVVDFSNKNNRNWSQAQIDGLTSFIYNLGPGALDQVTASGKRSDEEIAEAMQKYVNAGGKYNEGLSKRRKGEVAMFGGQVSSGSDAPTKGTSFAENLAKRQAGGEVDKEAQASNTLAAANLKAEGEETKAKESRMAKLQESMGLNIFGELAKTLGPMTQDLQKGYEENFAMQNTPSEPSVSSSDNSTTVVNVAGGGGGGGTTVNSVTPSHNYNQQFNSLAGGQRA